MSLRAHVKIAARRQQKLAGALVVVAGLGVVGVYLPAKRAIGETQQRITDLHAQLAADEQRASALPELTAAVDGLRRQVDRFKPLRGPSDIQQAFAQITQIKNETALQSYKFETNDAPRPLGTCLEQRVRITFQADFVDAMSFVGKIESMDRLTRVRELRITGLKSGGNGPQAGRVNVEVALSLFFKVGEAK